MGVAVEEGAGWRDVACGPVDVEAEEEGGEGAEGGGAELGAVYYHVVWCDWVKFLKKLKSEQFRSTFSNCLKNDPSSMNMGLIKPSLLILIIISDPIMNQSKE